MPFLEDLAGSVPIPTPGPRRAEALDTAPGLTAASHYENFSVVTWLTPRPLRPAFQSIYAFCRWSDDLGDEVGDPRAVARAARLVARRAAGDVRRPGPPPGHDRPGRDRRASSRIPIEPFEALISAFEQDQVVTDYDTYRPAPRLLHPLGQPGRAPGPLPRPRSFDAENARLSDATCTGAATGELLAGRGPRPGHRPDLPAPRGPRAVRLSPMTTCGRCGSRPAFAELLRVRGRAAAPCSRPGRAGSSPDARALAVDVDLFSRGAGDPRPDRAQGYDV